MTPEDIELYLPTLWNSSLWLQIVFLTFRDVHVLCAETVATEIGYLQAPHVSHHRRSYCCQCLVFQALESLQAEEQSEVHMSLTNCPLSHCTSLDWKREIKIIMWYSKAAVCIIHATHFSVKLNQSKLTVQWFCRVVPKVSQLLTVDQNYCRKSSWMPLEPKSKEANIVFLRLVTNHHKVRWVNRVCTLSKS